jgi:putative DNA primase/helicase
MNARQIVAALKGHWHGGYGQCRCPVHDDREPSLTVRDGDNAVLVKCFAGCEARDIIDALRRMGLVGEADPDQEPYRPAAWRNEPHIVEIDPEKTQAVHRIWRDAEPIQGTPATVYFRGRGIGLELPPSLRFHPGLKHGPTGRILPAVIAGVQGAGRSLNAVHRIYLRPDGSGKADVEKHQQKMTLGTMIGGAVRLACARETMGIAEGIETALSAMEMSGLPVWAACGSRLPDIALPPVVKRVVIFADNGEAGIEAAEKAKAALFAQNRCVAIRYPTIGKDWNDEIRARKGGGHG